MYLSALLSLAETDVGIYRRLLIPVRMTVNNCAPYVFKVLMMLWNTRTSIFNLQANFNVFNTNFRKLYS